MEDSAQLIELHGAMGKNSYRGGSAGDFNNDGKMDLIVLPIAGHSIAARKSNRIAIPLDWS